MLGLIWTLIQRYQLGIGVPVEEEPAPSDGASAAPLERKKTKKQASPSAKKLLLGWIRATLPDIGASNFTTDWNDGRRVSALVDKMKPGLIPNYATLDPADRLENTRNAMNLAEEHFGIPQVSYYLFLSVNICLIYIICLFFSYYSVDHSTRKSLC